MKELEGESETVRGKNQASGKREDWLQRAHVQKSTIRGFYDRTQCGPACEGSEPKKSQTQKKKNVHKIGRLGTATRREGHQYVAKVCQVYKRGGNNDRRMWAKREGRKIEAKKGKRIKQQRDRLLSGKDWD